MIGTRSSQSRDGFVSICAYSARFSPSHYPHGIPRPDHARDERDPPNTARGDQLVPAQRHRNDLGNDHVAGSGRPHGSGGTRHICVGWDAPHQGWTPDGGDLVCSSPRDWAVRARDRGVPAPTGAGDSSGDGSTSTNQVGRGRAPQPVAATIATPDPGWNPVYVHRACDRRLGAVCRSLRPHRAYARSCVSPDLLVETDRIDLEAPVQYEGPGRDALRPGPSPPAAVAVSGVATNASSLGSCAMPACPCRS